MPAASVSAAWGRLPGVKVIVLWSQVASTADAEAVRTIAAAGAQVMVAGPGWAEATLPTGVAQITTLRAAVERLLDVP